MEDDEFQIMQFMSYDTPMIDASERSIVKDGLARICCVALFSFFQGSIFFFIFVFKNRTKIAYVWRISRSYYRIDYVE